jgi:hypothetical protein
MPLKFQTKEGKEIRNAGPVEIVMRFGNMTDLNGFLNDLCWKTKGLRQFDAIDLNKVPGERRFMVDAREHSTVMVVTIADPEHIGDVDSENNN